MPEWELFVGCSAETCQTATGRGTAHVVLIEADGVLRY